MRQSDIGIGILGVIIIIWGGCLIKALTMYYQIDPCSGNIYGSGPCWFVLAIGVFFFLCAFGTALALDGD